MKIYRKYALCIIRKNRLLVLEEVDNAFYLLPGGRPEGDELPQQALCRELREELGVKVEEESLKRLGMFEDAAAGDESAVVRIELYLGNYSGEPQPCAEVKRLIWFAPSDDAARLAPVTRNKILPELIKLGLLH